MSHRQTPSHKQTSRIRDRGPRRERRRAVSLRPGLESLETRRLLSDFFDVTTTADSGPGSLRQAILDLNNSHDTAFINFDIGPGVQTIRPTSALPGITHPVDIDGSPSASFPTQVVVISGIMAGDVEGLVISAGSSTVENLVINGFSSRGDVTVNRNGILLEGGGGNVIEGCKIGTDAAGTQSVSNDAGVGIQFSADNTIGGTTPAERNIISGNEYGVAIAGSLSVGNVIQGNYIGTDPTGTKPVGNAIGVLFSDLGLGTTTGNFASGSTVGGTTPEAGNVISGNKLDGIEFFHSPGNAVERNDIGTTADGGSPLGNGSQGILVDESANNTIGGSLLGNVISANGGTGAFDSGVAIEGASSKGNLLQDNYIGVDAGGTKRIPNAQCGVLLADDAVKPDGAGPSNNTIGGTSVLVRNLISANSGDGILIKLGSNNSIEGNYIGVNALGSGPLGNAGNGVFIASGSGNVIGGDTGDQPPGQGPGNVISGNVMDGVVLDTADPTLPNTTANQVLGNIIGLDSGGTIADPDGKPNSGDELGNQVGVSIDNSPANTIGGPSPGSRNIISGNLGDGVDVDGANAVANLVLGNVIGTDVSGTLKKRGNAGDGVKIDDASTNTIGGLLPADGPGSNLISGNVGNGVELAGAGATLNQVMGNRIGTILDGTKSLSNRNGILITGPGNVIGGLDDGEGNVISGNLLDGVALTGADAHGNRLLQNLIGSDITGAKPVANTRDGVELTGAPNNTIGADTFDLGNLISGNSDEGLSLATSATTGNLIEGNDIGTTLDPTMPLGNSLDGILIDNATANTIGGRVTNANGQKSGPNVIGGNTLEGIKITGDSATKNVILGNFIGTDPTGTADVGNRDGGIFIDASNNTIGGTAAGAGNVIAHNGKDLQTSGFGVTVDSGTGESIRQNSIFLNSGRGIDLGNDPALHINDVGDADAGPNNRQNFPYETSVQDNGIFKTISWTLDSTPSSAFDIDFFSNEQVNHSGFGDGEQFLYSEHVTTDVNGMASFFSLVPSSLGLIAATATDSSGNTSEFSMIDSDADGLADAWEEYGIDVDGDADEKKDFMLPGAQPFHKDVYVEVDAMKTQAPQPLPVVEEPVLPPGYATGTYLDLVIASFMQAPQADVNNPDGKDGVNLHIELDETNIPLQAYTTGLNGFTDFYAQKAGIPGKPGGFGTAAERANPTALLAKSLAYRYAIFADEFVANTPDGGTTLGTSGIAEGKQTTVGTAPNQQIVQQGGNDFMVTLGDWDPPAAGSPFTQGDRQAATFMHELGHTLGLGHGGGDSINFKPNYISIMNYIWQMPKDWMYESALGKDVNGNGNMTDTTWKLDYSEQALPTLDENALVDTNGIGGDSSQWILYPYSRPPGPTSKEIPDNAPVDWDQDGVIQTFPTPADINNSGFGASLEVLIGHDDWSSLQYYFLESPLFQGQVSGDDDDDGGELTYAEELQLEGNGPPSTDPGTLQLGQASYDVHEDAGVVSIGVIRTGGSTGPVTIHYATAAGTATPGADYVQGAGDLNFIDGQLGATITVPIIDDSLAEGDETFTISLSNPTGGAALGSQSSASVTIDDDEKTTPATFLVTNASDSGPGSLRQAILSANAHLGADTIDFDIAGGTIILPESPLPSITDPVTIDATTQPGYAGTPLVQITGLLAGAGATGLTIQAGDTTVKGLIIDSFDVGIDLGGGGNTVQGNWIGLDMTGTLDLANVETGILIPADSRDNEIGGALAGLGNVVSNNGGAGVLVAGPDNRLLGNSIGTDSTGLLALGNAVGVVVTNAGNTIGGSGAGEGNLISGNLGDGIDILGTDATGNTLEGNVIGLDSAQGDSVGNGGDGVLIGDQASDNLIGGAGTGAGNVINNDDGIGIDLDDTSHNIIEGNLITVVDNSDEEEESGPAILVNDASDNIIGGTDPGAGNSITSDDAGVAILSGTGDAVRGNAIFVNDAIGIDLGWDGSTDNDPGDVDTGPNNLQNFPTVTGASLVGDSVVVVGDLDSTPLTAFSIDLYGNADHSPTGESYLTTVDVKTDASGHAHYSASVPTDALDDLYLVTATATDPGNNTSEFSPSFELDSDGDGQSDQDESFADNNGDGNADGVADRFQPNVASIGDIVSFVAPAGTQFRDVGFAENPSPFDVPGRANFTQGLFTWRLEGVAPGGSTTVELLLADFVNFNAYYRYGPTPAQKTPHWDTFAFDGTTGGQLGPQEITLHLVDGGRGDDDLKPNGVIEEVGGPVDGSAVYLVTNTNDDGPGSLRQAIDDSNFHGPIDTIAFDIGSGPQTIDILHALTPILDPVTIDGTTQPGYAGVPLIVLSGADDQDYTDVSVSDPIIPFIGLDIKAGSTTVRGLVIDGFGTRAVTYADSTQIGFIDDGTPILLDGSGGNVIAGNYIGTDITGTVGQGGFIGIDIQGSSNNRVGGTSPQDRNVISGLDRFGVELDSTSNDNVIEGNDIGTAADGRTALGNGIYGVVIGDTIHGNTIGGTAAGSGNVIAFNGAQAKAFRAAVGAGVWSNGPSGIGDPILGNSIFGNFGLGIDTNLSYNPLIGDGDYRAGSTLTTFNNQQVELPNYPILSSAADVGGNTVIQGRLHNSPNTTYHIEFFSNAQIDPSSFGEGKTYLGAISVTTDANGDVSFTATLATLDPTERFVTATATNAAGTTSEFSARVTIGDVLGSVYVVNTASDHDDGVANAADTSLREAIIAANNHPGLDTIEFDIGSGVQTISPMFDLPAIIDPVIIDATNQPGYQGTPLIVLTGTLTLPSNQVDPGTAFYGLRLQGGGSTIRGLAINDFDIAITIGGPDGGNTIEGSFIGTDATGTKTTVSGEGIDIFESSNNQIGGSAPADRNVISSNRFEGIRIFGGSNNVIQGNLIGTDVTGSKGFGNSTPLGGGDDISLQSASGTLIGGSVPGAGNVIAASDGAGIGIVNAPDTTIQGNLIGTDISGTKPLGSRGFGIQVSSSDVLIGGTEKGDGNLISSNLDTGVFIDGGDDVTIQGNHIGTDITGTKALGNGMGFWARSASGLTIGGTAAGAGNLIAGNLESGIVFTGDSDVVVQGNMVGTQADAINPLGNGIDGILLEDQLFGGTYPDSTGVTIGGTAAGAGNAIAFNAGRGVNIVAGSGISVLGNSLFSNGSLGIDLGGNGVTLNDDGDGDTGANGLQNFPVIAQAIAGATTHVVASLNGQPEEDDIISFYANSLADPSGFGEGQRYLGSVIAHTDAFGNATVELDLPARTGGGELLTATATDPDGNTSEFSLAVALTPTATIDSPSVMVGPVATTATFAVTLSVPSSQHVLIDYTTVDVTAHAGIDYTATTGTLDIPPGSLTGTIVVPVAANANAGPNLTFNLVLSLPQNVALVSTTATATLVPSGEPAGELAFRVANDTIQEDEGTVTITVVRSNGSAGVVTVDYTTSDGTGQAGVDYTAASGTLTFPDGVTTQTFTVPLLDNPNATTPVTVTLMLSHPTGGSTLGSQATATLTINPAPQFQGINVQEGSIGRSYIRYLDLDFKRATGLQSLIDSLNTTNPLLVLNFLGLNGTGNANVPLFASEVSIVNSNTLRIDFGRGGITGDPTSSGGDGYYQISVESQNAATITTKTFFRLFGDVNGDGVVDNSDIAIVNAAIGRSGSNLAADLDGSLAVNTIDLQYARNAKKKGNELSFDLHLDD